MTEQTASHSDPLLVTVLPFLSGILMASVFVINVYIGLYDTTLIKLNTLHYDLNWAIAGVDIIAAGLLLSRYRPKLFVPLGGIVWPLVYLLSLFLDVQTSLCGGTNFVNCYPTVDDAYKYLILNSKAEGWVLWPYTIRTDIVVLAIVIVLSVCWLAYTIEAGRKSKLGREPRKAATR